MRGFFVGSLALVVAYVAVQKNTADKVTAASGTFSSAFRRVLSGEVAGLPNRPVKIPADSALSTDPNTSPGPKATMPPPGANPALPPYLWDLTHGGTESA